MRAGFVIAVLAMAAASGCKGKNDASAAPDPAAVKAQQELVERQKALLAQREELEKKSDALETEIKAVEAKGSDATELRKQKADLDTQIQSRSSDFNQLSNQLESQARAQGDQSALLAARLDKVAQAEADVARREADVQKKLDDIEQLVKRLESKCGQSGPALVIQQAPAGGAHSRKDIEPLLAQARKDMAKRGILPSDLPTPAQGLEGEAQAAMTKNDWGTAYLAAAQYAGQVAAIRIDRKFVTDKYQRLQQRVQGATVDPAVRKQLDDGMKDIVEKFGSGDLAGANHKINVLYSLLK